MPIVLGPNLNEAGLVYAYDTTDRKNSFMGEPTANLATDLGLTDLGAGLTYLGIENGWKKYSLGGTWTGGGYPYSMALNAVSFTGGLPYTSKATLKTNVENKFNYFATTGISYVNQPKDAEGTLSSTFNADDSRTVDRVNFAYTSTTGQLGYLFTNPINGTTFNPSTDFVWLKDFQIEQKAYATPFVNGTRSATQSILDLANGITADVSAVSFNSSGNMLFDGTNDSLVISNSALLKNNRTSIEFVIKFNSTPFGDIIQFGVGSGDYAQYYYRAYSGNSYWVWYPASAIGYGEITIPNSVFGIGNYKHVVMTGDAYGNAKFFVNGVQQGGVTYTRATTPATWTPASLTVGGFSWDGYSNSEIPYVKIYNRVLLDSEIISHFNQVKTKFNIQ
jgi:hypothetical protein